MQEARLFAKSASLRSAFTSLLCRGCLRYPPQSSHVINLVAAFRHLNVHLDIMGRGIWLHDHYLCFSLFGYYRHSATFS